MVVGEGPEEYTIDDTEGGGCGADAQTEGKHRYGAEGGPVHQGAQSVAKVVKERLQTAPPLESPAATGAGRPLRSTIPAEEMFSAGLVPLAGLRRNGFFADHPAVL